MIPSDIKIKNLTKLNLFVHLAHKGLIIISSQLDFNPHKRGFHIIISEVYTKYNINNNDTIYRNFLIMKSGNYIINFAL